MTSFADRHIGTDSVAHLAMLDAVGYDSLDALMDAAVPSSIRLDPTSASRIPTAASEREALAELRRLADRNRMGHSMIGLGYYDTLTPSVIQRNVLENPSWYTAYTPYQPEISQGRLEALINFQTMITDLTGLATANASMLDEATAVVEGMLLARRVSGAASGVFVVDSDAFPQTKALLAHRADAVGIELMELDLAGGATVPECFGVFVQYPGASGRLWDPSGVVAADLLALTLVKAPGEFGADIAVGTSQRFGVPMGFGGPHAGYMAVRDGL
ncbi:MAG TPA: glycine dehydrogenase (aminomethyl-transferring), partial [Pseudolysinimonas sp.]